jgi:hypothetical protein
MEILILGVWVRGGEVKMEKNKVQVVQEWETPKKLKDVESFLGFMNFYRCFIWGFCYSDTGPVLSWRSTYPQIVPKETPSWF